MGINHIYAVEFKPFMQEVIRYPALDGADLRDVMLFMRDAVREAGKNTLMSVEHGVAENRFTGEKVPFTAYRLYELPEIYVHNAEGMDRTDAERMAVDALMDLIRVGDEMVQEVE